MSNFYFTDAREVKRHLQDPEVQRQLAEKDQALARYELSSQFRRSRQNALISSEVRNLGARLTDFCQMLEPFMDGALDAERSKRLVELYTRFSAELSTIEAATYQLAGSARFFSSAVDVLRTPLEEGIISLLGNSSGPYSDPKYVRTYMQCGYRSILRDNQSVLIALSPDVGRAGYPLRVHIEEYGLERTPLTPERCAELLELTNSRVIDTSRPEPQEGFGLKYTTQDFMALLERRSTRCCVPFEQDEALGLYVLDVDHRNIPQTARALIEQSTQLGPLNASDGWVDIICLAVTARDRLRSPIDVLYVAREHQALSNKESGGHEPQAARPCKENVHHPGAPDEPIESGASAVLEKVLLTPTHVSDVGPGDFVRDLKGALHEISHNSAYGLCRPSSWQIATTDGLTFDLYSIGSYLKREQQTELAPQTQSAPSLYRWLTLCACQTACAAGLSHLWCKVRVGRQANTSREKHLAVGWEPTGLVFRCDGYEYEILRIDTLKVITGLSDEDLRNVRQDSAAISPEYERLRSLAKEAWSVSSGDYTEAHCMTALRSAFPECSITHTTDPIGRLNVTVTSRSGRSIFFHQGLAGHDLWRVQDDPCYSSSLYNPLASLMATIKLDHDALCSMLSKATR